MILGAPDLLPHKHRNIHSNSAHSSNLVTKKQTEFELDKEVFALFIKPLHLHSKIPASLNLLSALNTPQISNSLSFLFSCSKKEKRTHHFFLPCQKQSDSTASYSVFSLFCSYYIPMFSLCLQPNPSFFIPHLKEMELTVSSPTKKQNQTLPPRRGQVMIRIIKFFLKSFTSIASTAKESS